LTDEHHIYPTGFIDAEIPFIKPQPFQLLHEMMGFQTDTIDQDDFFFSFYLKKISKKQK